MLLAAGTRRLEMSFPALRLGWFFFFVAFNIRRSRVHHLPHPRSSTPIRHGKRQERSDLPSPRKRGKEEDVVWDGNRLIDSFFSFAFLASSRDQYSPHPIFFALPSGESKSLRSCRCAPVATLLASGRVRAIWDGAEGAGVGNCFRFCRCRGPSLASSVTASVPPSPLGKAKINCRLR